MHMTIESVPNCLGQTLVPSGKVTSNQANGDPYIPVPVNVMKSPPLMFQSSVELIEVMVNGTSICGTVMVVSTGITPSGPCTMASQAPALG